MECVSCTLFDERITNEKLVAQKVTETDNYFLGHFVTTTR